VSQTGPPKSESSIAIAGGGIIGLSIAWRLAQSGWHVDVFDQGEIGGEASWAAAGMLSPGGEFEGPSDLAVLAIESRRMYSGFVRELEQASGLSIDYQECGALDLAYSSEELESLELRATSQADLGILSKPLTAEQVSVFWPRVRTEHLTGARFYPEDAVVNPREIVSALAAACRALTVSLVPHCRITRIDVSDRAVGVESGRGYQTYDAAVVAAGAWSSAIRLNGAIPMPAVEPVKGHLIGYRQPEQVCNTIVRRGHLYLLQRANGLLIAGSTVERVGFDRDVRSAVVAELASGAGFVFPHLLETASSEAWTGFRPGSDRLQLGAWHSPRLYLAYGHYRNGILLAPVTAQKLTSEISANLQKR
jgi:glycine oxidase